MEQTKAEILLNKEVAPFFFKIRLRNQRVCRYARPGQFLMVRCSENTDPFLRRPLSLHRIRKDNFELLYQVRGKGTRALSEKKKGQKLDILGPLGNGFDTDLGLKSQGVSILVAGGVGVAPLLALAEKFYKIGYMAFSVFIGAKKKDRLLCENDFKKLGVKVYVATEDGSRGHKGLITGLVKKIFSTRQYPLGAIYACGPKDMLKNIAQVAKSKRVPCQVSLEEIIACGTGMCLGCVVRSPSGYRLVCKDGPVFNAGDIVW